MYCHILCGAHCFFHDSIEYFSITSARLPRCKVELLQPCNPAALQHIRISKESKHATGDAHAFWCLNATCPPLLLPQHEPRLIRIFRYTVLHHSTAYHRNRRVTQTLILTHRYPLVPRAERSPQPPNTSKDIE